MASSVVVALRNAVVTGLQALPALSAVQVTYGWPGDDLAQRQRIFTNRARAGHEPASLRNGRTYRNEAGTFEVTIQVVTPASSAYEADTAAMTLGQSVEEYVADNRTALAATVTGLLWVRTDGFELTNLYNDTGYISELTYTIRYSARLT